MYKVTKKIDFAYGHRLLNYDGPCNRLHGHNGTLEIDVASDELDELGMVVDFTLISEKVKGWVDAHLDHKMLLCDQDPVAALLQNAKEPLFLMKDNPTAENIARMVFFIARENGLPACEVRLWETPTGCASFKGAD